MYQSFVVTFEIIFAQRENQQRIFTRKVDEDDLPIEKKSRSSVRITINQTTGRAAPSGCRAEPIFLFFFPKPIGMKYAMIFLWDPFSKMQVY